VKKLYFHAGGVCDGQRVVCPECGAELDYRLLSEVPCRMPTVYYTEIEGILWAISVWNCTPLIIAMDVKAERPLTVEFCDPILKEDLEQMAYDAVDKVGAINWSGLYGLSEEMGRAIESALKDNKITVGKEE